MQKLKKIIIGIKNISFIYLRIIKWLLLGRPAPAPHLIKQRLLKKIAKKASLKIMVETGTFKGAMIESCRKQFDKLISIELSEEYYNKAKKKFAKYDHIKIIKGDSGIILPKILKEINKPALFWLDGHYSGGNTSKGELNTPIIKELGAILSHKNKEHVILIDDARCFNGTDDYPTIDMIRKYIQNKNLNLYMEIKNDIIIISLIKFKS
jgi:hypothetical protein